MLQDENKIKSRLSYLDFIRAIATSLIILTHYNAVYLYLPTVNTQGIIFTAYINKLYIGDWGVSLFLILSGASLMHVYRKKFDIWNFYKKRFWAIFPLYWFTYLLVMSSEFVQYQTINPNNAPGYKLLLSFIGFDTYLSGITSTWASVGEWFLGLIILIYILFPILIWMIDKYEYLLWFISLVIYFVIIRFYPFKLYPSMNIFIRLPEFIFGMAYIKHSWGRSRKIVWCVIILLALDMMHSNWAGSGNKDFRTSYLGICAFILLAKISDRCMRINIVAAICNQISKYSFIIFLVHHRIIWKITGRFDLNSITTEKSVFLLIICVEIIILYSICILFLFNKLKQFFKSNL